MEKLTKNFEVLFKPGDTFINKNGAKCKILDVSETDLGYKEVTFQFNDDTIDCKNAWTLESWLEDNGYELMNNKPYRETAKPQQHLTDYQKKLVKEMVEMLFDCGHYGSDYDEVLDIMKEDEDLAPVAEEATDYYFELGNSGPENLHKESSDDEEPYSGEDSEIDFSDSNEKVKQILAEVFPSENTDVKDFGVVITFADRVDLVAVKNAMDRIKELGFDEVHSQTYGNKAVITYIPA